MSVISVTEGEGILLGNGIFLIDTVRSRAVILMTIERTAIYIDKDLCTFRQGFKARLIEKRGRGKADLYIDKETTVIQSHTDLESVIINGKRTE